MADPVRELVIKISVENDTKKGFDEVDKGQEKARTKSVALGTALGGLAVKLGEVAAQALKAGAAMLKDLVFGTAEAADEVAKTSAKLGVASDQLQRLRGAAQLSGAAVTDLDGGVRDLTKNLGEAIEKGGGPAVEALATLGLEVAEVDAILQEGDVEGALGLIGDAVNEVNDPIRTNAALMKLMGGAGAQLGPLLAQGTDGIKGLGDQISETGAVIEDDALKQFEALQDSQLLLDQQILGVKNTIATAAAPAFTEIGDRVREWTAENQGVLDQDLPALLVGIADSAVTLVTGTLELVSIWREFARDASDLAEIMAEDVDPGMQGVTNVVDSLSVGVSGLSLAVLDLVDGFLEAVGAGEELRQIFKEIRGDVEGASGTQGSRGAPAFLGGGDSLINPNDFNQADQTGDTSKLKKIAADPRFSETDRARASSVAGKIDAREAAKAEAEAQAQAAKRERAVEASREKSKRAQRGQAKAARRAKAGAGGGGGAKQPTVEDLIGLAQGPGGAAPAALRSASSALSGTLLVTTVNNFNMSNTVDVGGIQVSAALTDVGPEVATALRPVVADELAAQTREARDWLEARSNVGF